MGLATIITYAAYMVAFWLQDNTLVQQSLATLGPQVWASTASLPWATHPLVPSLGSLALRLTVDGNPGACSAPKLQAPIVEGGAFRLESRATCSGAAQHTLTCPSCQLYGQITAQLLFDYSCQSMHLEALAAGPGLAEPKPSISVMQALPSRTAAKPGALLSSFTWQLTPVLSVLWDNVSSSNSATGWYLADSKLTEGAPLAPPALNGSLSLLPTAAPVTVNLVLAVSSTYSVMLVTQRVPITQLLANIVGLSGLLALFGSAFGAFEASCSKHRAGSKHTPLSSGQDEAKGRQRTNSETEGLLARLVAREARLAALEARAGAALPARTVSTSATQGALPNETAEGSAFSVSNPLAAKQVVLPQQQTPPAVAPQLWRRLRDEKDEWFMCQETGATAWVAPNGALVVD